MLPFDAIELMCITWHDHLCIIRCWLQEQYDYLYRLAVRASDWTPPPAPTPSPTPPPTPPPPVAERDSDVADYSDNATSDSNNNDIDNDNDINNDNDIDTPVRYSARYYVVADDVEAAESDSFDVRLWVTT